MLAAERRHTRHSRAARPPQLASSILDGLRGQTSQHQDNAPGQMIRGDARARPLTSHVQAHEKVRHHSVWRDSTSVEFTASKLQNSQQCIKTQHLIQPPPRDINKRVGKGDTKATRTDTTEHPDWVLVTFGCPPFMTNHSN